MSCDKYLELMSAVLDGEATAKERNTLDGHLADCPSCQALFDELSAQSGALRELDCQLPAHLHGHIMDSLPPQDAPAKKGKVIRWQRWGSLAACLVLVVVAAVAQPWNKLNTPRSGEDPAAAEASQPIESPTPGVVAEMLPTAAKIQYLRASYGSTPDAPSAVVLDSVDGLNTYLTRFPHDDFSASTAPYDAAYFETGRLLAIVLEADSGSISYELETLTQEQVAIRTIRPEVGTCDMAAWLILAEVDTAFTGGDTLEVVLSN